MSILVRTNNIFKNLHTNIYNYHGQTLYYTSSTRSRFATRETRWHGNDGCLGPIHRIHDPDGKGEHNSRKHWNLTTAEDPHTWKRHENLTDMARMPRRNIRAEGEKEHHPILGSIMYNTEIFGMKKYLTRTFKYDHTIIHYFSTRLRAHWKWIWSRIGLWLNQMTGLTENNQNNIKHVNISTPIAMALNVLHTVLVYWMICKRHPSNGRLRKSTMYIIRHGRPDSRTGKGLRIHRPGW